MNNSGLNKSKQAMIINRKKILRIIGLFLGVVGAVFIGWKIYISYHDIQVVDYEIVTNNISESIKFVIIGDLHDRTYGEDNLELVESILNQKPDAILMVGDMINDTSKTADNIEFLIKTLSDRVPVYFAFGNHEYKWNNTKNEDLFELIKTSGAVILNEEYVDVELNNQDIRLGGLYSYSYVQSYDKIDKLDDSNINVKIYDFFTRFQDTEKFKILLSHRPDSFAIGNASELWDIDLTIHGHLHGGQVNLPYFGRVFGGGQGLFPEYVHGLYEKGNVQMLITSGLGDKPWGLPRWNIPPEIMVLKLKPK